MGKAFQGEAVVNLPRAFHSTARFRAGESTPWASPFGPKGEIFSGRASVFQRDILHPSSMDPYSR